MINQPISLFFNTFYFLTKLKENIHLTSKPSSLQPPNWNNQKIPAEDLFFNSTRFD